MKPIAFVLACLLTPIFIFGQGKRERLKENSFNSENFGTFTVEIEKGGGLALDKLKNPLSSVLFIDRRADTTKLGFVRSGEDLSYKRFIFPEGEHNYITERMNKKLKADNGSNFVFVLHHLWLSQAIIKASTLKSLVTGPKQYVSYCYINADCYAQNDKGLKYLGQADSVVYIKKWIGNIANDIIGKTLSAAITVADSLYSMNKKNNEYLTYQQFNDKYSNKYNYAILTTQQPAKGIYLSYESFLNNAPDAAAFEVVENKKKETKTLESASLDTAVTNKAWGYSDGSAIYKHINDNYYRMNRVQNTFELAGPRTINRLYMSKDELILNVAINTFLYGIIAGFLTPIGADNLESKIMKELVPYQLNIKEGTIY